MNIRQRKIFLLVTDFCSYNCKILSVLVIVAEEREELEVLNNFRQKQLELKHRQLLQELESLQSARETNTLTTTTQTPIDSNFKHLM